jgi:hypothetical protein
VFVDAAFAGTAVNENVPAAPVLVTLLSVMLPLPPRTFAVQLSPGPIVSIALAAPVDIVYVPVDVPITDSAIERMGLELSLALIDIRSADRDAVIDAAVHADPLIRAVIVRLELVPVTVVVVVGLVVLEPPQAGMAHVTASRTPRT